MSDQIARSANATNNEAWQELRFERWASVRDEVWNLVEPLLRHGTARVGVVGAGNCDDIPIARIAQHAASVDMIDFDPTSTTRAVERLIPAYRERIQVIEADVTDGCADLVLRAARDGSTLPEELPLPYGALGAGEYDLVIGDMLYTQLLHPGLISLGLPRDEQSAIMRRYDQHFTSALVWRLQASAAETGHVVHIHDLACWSTTHEQPLTIDAVLEDPFWRWTQLRRHDLCDPQLALGRLGIEVLESRWWRWPFEPNKAFLVRASLAPGTMPTQPGSVG